MGGDQDDEDFPREQQDRLLALVCDIVLEQGGQWAATESVLRGTFLDDDDLEVAKAFAIVPLYVYEEPGGPAFVRAMRDRRRHLLPAEGERAKPRKRWTWKIRG